MLQAGSRHRWWSPLLAFRAFAARRGLRPTIRKQPHQLFLEYLESRTLPDVGLGTLSSALLSPPVDDVLVQLKPANSGAAQQLQQLVAANQASLTPVYDGLYRVQAAGRDLSTLVATLAAQPYIKYAEPNLP